MLFIFAKLKLQILASLIKMNQIASCVVSQYIQEDFLPATQKAIQEATTKKKSSQIIPALLTNKVIETFVKPTLQNGSQTPCYPSHPYPLSENADQMQQGLTIHVSKKRHNSVMNKPTSIAKVSKIKEHKGQARPNSRITTQSTALIKLPQGKEEEDYEITKMRKIKALSKKFEKMREDNKLENEKIHKQAKYHKQSSLNDCLYHQHTYDYEADIVKVHPDTLSDFPQPIEDKSFLQIIKSNLDQQIDNQRVNNKLEQVKQLKSKVKHSNITPRHVLKLEQFNENYIPVNNEPPEAKQIDRALKPPSNFQRSSIRSLAKNIQESFIAEGVKMITHEQNIVQEQSRKASPLFKVHEQEIVKENQRKSKKQKTNTSQSVIYSSQSQLKNQSILEYLTNSLKQNIIQCHQNYQSLEQNPEGADSGFLTQLLKRYSNHQSIEVESRIDSSRFPLINRRQHKVRLRKRTDSQQKSTKGLSGIQVKVSTPQMQKEVHFSHRSAHSSSMIKKQTQSSFDQVPYDSSVSRKSPLKIKKELVRGYYKNYRQQFRHKLKGIQQALKLYS